MKAGAGVVGLALLLAALPAQAQRGGGGHFGSGRFGGHFGGARGGPGGRGGSRGGAMATHSAGIARMPVSTAHSAGIGSRRAGHVVFVLPRGAQGSMRIPTMSGQHLLAKPQSPSMPISPSTLSVSPAPARMPLVTASSPHVTAPPGLVNPAILPFRHQGFFGSRGVFFGGDGFFCPVFFDGFLSPFCPVCDLGVVNPFFFHRPFFFPFGHRRFVGGFFTPTVPFFGPGLVSDSERVGQQPPAEQPEAGKLEKAPESAPLAAPQTLLVFTDGSAYGVADYWLDDGRLHYLTSDGVEKSVPLERIDLYATVKVNWERGVQFTLRPQRSR